MERMTKEDAIKILDPKTSRETLLEWMGNVWNQTQALMLISEAQKVGLEALRAKGSFIELGKDLWEGRQCSCRDVITEREWVMSGKQYCPYCGRPLTAESLQQLNHLIQNAVK